MHPSGVLAVRFMSVFELTYAGKKLNMGTDGASKSVQLLAVLLYHAEAGIPREKLLKLLYPDGEADAANSLKALVFRLRKRLALMGLPNREDYITVHDGVYRFTGEIPLESDVGTFNYACAAAEAEQDPAARAAFNEKACLAYTGELLPLLAGEMWVIVENAALTERVMKAAKSLGAYLTEQRDYGRAYELNRRMSSLFPFEEEWYVGRMQSLISEGKYQQAMDEYEAVTSMLFDEMGVYPSERIMDCARAISNKVLFQLSAAADVNHSLKENASVGAYYCSYPSFVDSYRILRRIMSRENVDSCLLLCAVVDKNKRPLEDKTHLVPAIQKLGIALGRTLRKSDMYTRYSPSQMLAMLWGCPPSNADISIQRINGAYLEQAGEEGIEVSYTVLAGDEPPRPVVMARVEPGHKKWKRIEG